MKKILLTISIFFYLIASNGAVLDMDYCMDKLVSVSFLLKKSDQCPLCGMKMDHSNKGCCHHEKRLLSLDRSTNTGDIYCPGIDLECPSVLPDPLWLSFDQPEYYLLTSIHSLHLGDWNEANICTCPSYKRFCIYLI